MIWYIVICILMIYPLSLNRAGELNGRDTRPLALGIGCGILWFFMAFRGTSVGMDNKYYSYVFTQFAKVPFKDVFTAVVYATESETWSFDFEPGYRLVNKILSLFTHSPQAITIFNSSLIIILLYRVIRDHSPDYMLSIWLYITLGVYQTEMNVTRNAIAILMVYNAFNFLKERKLWQYLVTCIFASTFHVAALMLIPVYWLVHYFKLTPRLCLIIVAGASALGVVFPYISPFIRMILPSNLDRYFMDRTESLGSILVGMFNGGLFVICYFMMTAEERERAFQDCAPGIMMLMINLFFFGLNIGLDDAARMAALYGPYTLILIPKMIALMKSPVKRKNATVLVTTVSGIVYILRMLINNIGGTMPYEFYW